MSFYYLEQNTNTGNSSFENFGFDKTFNIENFEGMPPIDAKNTDSNYQCSDNVQITGNAIGSSVPNSTLSDCKSRCKSDGSCIGFDFDNSSSSCTLRNTITDLTSTKQNNVMCVKKTSSACKVTPQTNPQDETQKIFNEMEQENNLTVVPGIPTPQLPSPTSNIPGSYNPSSPSTNPSSPSTNPSSPSTNPIPTPTTPEKMNKSSCKPDTIFVDLPCFLNKMDVLKNHSDNLMIDLQLLITNLKSCSYIRKPAKKSITTNPFKPINGGTSDDDWSMSGNFSGFFGTSGESSNTVANPNIPVAMPTQETIKVYNSAASVLYTNNPATNTNVMLGITEPFQNSEQQTSFLSSFTFKIIVLVFILVLLMNMK
jgi:hypothetical protein